MLLERWRPVSNPLLAAALRLSLTPTLYLPGCSRSSDRAETAPASSPPRANAQAQAAAPGANADADAAEAAGELLGRLISDAAPKERRGGEPEADIREPAPPRGFDLRARQPSRWSRD